jgi:hypothetical protein
MAWSPRFLPSTCIVLLLAAGGARGQPLDGVLRLARRDGTPAGELVVVPPPVRLLREGHEPRRADAAVQVGARLYALYGPPAEAGAEGARGERLLGVYRIAEGARATEERVVRVEERPAAAPPRAASLDALAAELQALLASPEVASDLAALRSRGAELALEVLRLQPMQVDQAEALLSAGSRTPLARQPLDSRSALALFRVGALRDPPPGRAGVRALSELLRREVVPGRFVRTHLLTGAGAVASRRFGDADELETWVLLAETRAGDLLAVRLEWCAEAPR